jgi:hypothetical protein
MDIENGARDRGRGLEGFEIVEKVVEVEEMPLTGVQLLIFNQITF